MTREQAEFVFVFVLALTCALTGLWISLRDDRRARRQARNEEMLRRAFIAQDEFDRQKLIEESGRKPWQ